MNLCAGSTSCSFEEAALTPPISTAVLSLYQTSMVTGKLIKESVYLQELVHMVPHKWPFMVCLSLTVKALGQGLEVRSSFGLTWSSLFSFLIRQGNYFVYNTTSMCTRAPSSTTMS